MKKIAVFDFDGTLIKQDSMILFFFKYFKPFSLSGLACGLRLLIDTIKFFLKLYSQKQYKQKFINLIIQSSKIKDIEKLGTDFSEYLLKKIYTDSIKTIKRLEKEGCELVLLSASPDFYLKKIKTRLGFSNLICTKTQYINGKIILKENCFGENKIKLFLEEYQNQNINWKSSYCFSDSISDYRLFSYFGNAFAINNKKLTKINPDINFIKWT